MKILNEKGLVHFANSGAPADKEGYLHKKGELNKGFQKRWFVLKGNLLFYYEKKGDKEPVGVIVLEGCTIELAEDSDNFLFMINFASFASSSTRTYCISAHSQESMESWMKALSCAGYEYIKLVVSELQSKLEDASSNAKAELVQAAVRDSQILGRMYSDSYSIVENRSSEPRKRVNPFDSKNTEIDPGDAIRPLTKISNVKLITWQIFQLHSFAEMHELIRQQIIEFTNDGCVS